MREVDRLLLVVAHLIMKLKIVVKVQRGEREIEQRERTRTNMRLQ